ncbi:hypothetical protein GIB67_032914 [Kingdonia uniflora]|uniref:RING-type domain-containing protein n=1 Tax=Kingdonia uniflora TaxID=39325 RepID=A0A7J7MYG9_9MAGN|nr:hypothetical protein GIB67_032914 [Kingdonia uniflora]
MPGPEREEVELFGKLVAYINGVEKDGSVARANNGEVPNSGVQEVGSPGIRNQVPVEPEFGQIRTSPFVRPGEGDTRKTQVNHRSVENKVDQGVMIGVIEMDPTKFFIGRNDTIKVANNDPRDMNNVGQSSNGIPIGAPMILLGRLSGDLNRGSVGIPTSIEFGPKPDSPKPAFLSYGVGEISRIWVRIGLSKQKACPGWNVTRFQVVECGFLSCTLGWSMWGRVGFGNHSLLVYNTQFEAMNPDSSIVTGSVVVQATNRSAKLKRCKLDARREQWLSQVKNKGAKEDSSGRDDSPASTFPPIGEPDNGSLGSSETRSLGEENENENENEGLNVHDSVFETLIDSSISSHCFSRSVSGDEEEGEEERDGEGEEDGCLDDWEAVADALIANDEKASENSETPESQSQPLPVGSSSPKSVDVPKPEVAVKRCAWRPDDAFRPQSLPNLSKQYSFPTSSDLRYGHGTIDIPWVCRNILSQSQPSSCPICYEDLDLTDSSFLPCLCGFRLCLFCHKRILEADGRCPGCRKKYDDVKGEITVNRGAASIRLTRSSSMSTGS